MAHFDYAFRVPYSTKSDKQHQDIITMIRSNPRTADIVYMVDGKEVRIEADFLIGLSRVSSDSDVDTIPLYE